MVSHLLLCAVLGGLAVEVRPAELLNVPGAQAEVLLSGVPAGAELPSVRLSTSTGEVGPLEPLGEGRFRAVYRPPQARFPQVALFAARAGYGPTETRAYAALPLLAKSNLKLLTKPRTEVTVTVAGRNFGPVRADKKGNATVPVEVPPGHAEAQVTSTDRAGNRSVRPVNLSPPPFAQVVLLPLGGTAVGSWEGPPLELELFAVHPNGEPSQVAPSLRATDGSVSTATAVGGGLFRATFQAPKKLRGATAAVEAWLGEAPDVEDDLLASLVPDDLEKAVPARLEVTLRPGSPTALSLSVEPDALSAGGVTEAALRVVAQDAHGNPVPTELARWEADFGKISSGEGGPILQISPDFGGRTEVTVRAELQGARAERRVPLRPGVPVALALSLEGELVPAGEALPARLRVTDAHGNPVPGIRPQLGAGAASLEVSEDAQGYALVARVADAATPGASVLEVRVDGVAEPARAEYAILPPRRPWGVSLGLFARGHTNLVRASGGGPWLEVSVRPGRAPVEAFLTAGAQLYPELRGAHPTGPQGVSMVTSVRALGAGAGARASLPLGPHLSLYATLAGGLRRTSSEIVVEGGVADGVRQAQTRWEWMGLVAGGGHYRLGPGRLLLELSGMYGPAGGQLSGNLGGGVLGMGYLWEVR